MIDDAAHLQSQINDLKARVLIDVRLVATSIKDLRGDFIRGEYSLEFRRAGNDAWERAPVVEREERKERDRRAEQEKLKRAKLWRELAQQRREIDDLKHQLAGFLGGCSRRRSASPGSFVEAIATGMDDEDDAADAPAATIEQQEEGKTP